MAIGLVPCSGMVSYRTRTSARVGPEPAHEKKRRLSGTLTSIISHIIPVLFTGITSISTNSWRRKKGLTGGGHWSAYNVYRYRLDGWPCPRRPAYPHVSYCWGRDGPERARPLSSARRHWGVRAPGRKAGGNGVTPYERATKYPLPSQLQGRESDYQRQCSACGFHPLVPVMDQSEHRWLLAYGIAPDAGAVPGSTAVLPVVFGAAARLWSPSTFPRSGRLQDHRLQRFDSEVRGEWRPPEDGTRPARRKRKTAWIYRGCQDAHRGEGWKDRVHLAYSNKSGIVAAEGSAAASFAVGIACGGPGNAWRGGCSQEHRTRNVAVCSPPASAVPPALSYPSFLIRPDHTVRDCQRSVRLSEGWGSSSQPGKIPSHCHALRPRRGSTGWV